MSKDRDYLMNKAQCAGSIGISVNAFAQWKVPSEKVGTERLYALSDILEVYRKRVERELRPAIADEVRAELAGVDAEDYNPATLKIEIDIARKRLTEAQAEAQEEKNRMARHEIAPFGFISFSLAALGNSLASALDSIPTVLIRQAGIPPQEAEKVRSATASVANQIADICDEEWVTKKYDEYLAEMDR